MNPELPASARLGLAFSFYYLKKYSMAKYTFLRILELDCNIVEAYLGLCSISNLEGSQNMLIYYLNKACSVNFTHPILQLYLAEHYLLRREYSKVLICVKRGLKNLE